jgi:hypothetical protein
LPYRAHTDIVLRAERNGRRILLRSVEQRVFRSPETFASRDESGLLTRSRIEYSGAPHEQLPLYSGARLVNRHYRDDPQDAFWGVADIKLLDARSVDHPPDAFLARFTEDSIVADTRLNVAYQLGTDTINIDGRLLKTHEPVTGDVAERLGWWVSHGHFIISERGQDGNARDDQ